MTEDVCKSINQIRELSPKLNRATDKANEIVARVETFLNEECSIGIPALVLIDWEAVSTNAKRRKWLVYERIDGKFRIGVETDLVENAERANEQVTREDLVDWSSCSRALKLEAFGRLPTLLRQIVEEVTRVTETTTGVAETVDEIVVALNGE